MLSYTIPIQELIQLDTITHDIVLKAASAITEMFQVKIGTFSLPELYKSIELAQQQHLKSTQQHSKPTNHLTTNMFANMPYLFELSGRIIIDLAANGEHDGDFNYKNPIQVHFPTSLK
jgi:hypothetical protein